MFGFHVCLGGKQAEASEATVKFSQKEGVEREEREEIHGRGGGIKNRKTEGKGKPKRKRQTNTNR